jgi:hypothetical protein
MILYTEKQLQQAWQDNCKVRSKLDLPWLTIEEFRPIYEEEMEKFMLGEYD